MEGGGSSVTFGRRILRMDVGGLWEKAVIGFGSDLAAWRGTRRRKSFLRGDQVWGRSRSGWDFRSCQGCCLRNVVMWQMPAVCLLSKAEKRSFPSSTVSYIRNRANESLGTAASRSTNDQPRCETRRKASWCDLPKQITNSKDHTSEFKYSRFRRVLIEGLVSSCRIRHESHTCSELSCRIWMWNSSIVQKHFVYTWQDEGNRAEQEGSRP